MIWGDAEPWLDGTIPERLTAALNALDGLEDEIVEQQRKAAKPQSRLFELQAFLSQRPPYDQLVAETRSPDQRKGKNLGPVPDQLEQCAVFAELERVGGTSRYDHRDQGDLQQITKLACKFRLYGIADQSSPPWRGAWRGSVS